MPSWINRPRYWTIIRINVRKYRQNGNKNYLRSRKKKKRFLKSTNKLNY